MSVHLIQSDYTLRIRVTTLNRAPVLPSRPAVSLSVTIQPPAAAHSFSPLLTEHGGARCSARSFFCIPLSPVLSIACATMHSVRFGQMCHVRPLPSLQLARQLRLQTFLVEGSYTNWNLEQHASIPSCRFPSCHVKSKLVSFSPTFSGKCHCRRLPSHMVASFVCNEEHMEY